MNELNNYVSLSTNKKPGRRNMRSLEYEIMASLTLQTFVHGDQIDYGQLLSIEQNNRIPALIKEYGLKKMYQIVMMIIKEFNVRIPLSKAKKLNETQSGYMACELILVAYEDYLSLEDLIIFFEMTLKGKYGSIKKMLTYSCIQDKIDQYRQQRHEHYMTFMEQKSALNKSDGPQEHTCPEPTAIWNLFDDASVPAIPLKKII